MITVVGSAANKATDCNPSKPLLIINTAVIAAINTPKIAFTASDGFSFPSDVIIPRTYIVESVDVTRKIFTPL